MAALVMLFPPEGSRDYYVVFGNYFLPEGTIDRPENTHYQGWERAGFLTETPGAVTDFDQILDAIDDLAGRYEVLEVASDPWKNVPIVAAMQKRGVSVPVVDVRQSSLNLTPAMLELEALVVSGRVRHDGDPILSWMIANVICHRAGQDLIQPRKDSEEKKIDGVLSLLMALCRAMKHQEPADFEKRGLWSV
jgi:phage terminase large subunit-like protein